MLSALSHAKHILHLIWCVRKLLSLFVASSCSNGRDDESWESKCSPFAPNPFPCTLILLRFLLRRFFLRTLQVFSRRWYHTTQSKPVALRILHRTLNM